MKALIYQRVSTQDQHPENQLAQLRAYADKQGWSVVDVVTDRVSGTKTREERPGLDKVFRLAHRRKFDVLLFWSLDRLSREGTRQTLEYLTALESYKVKYHSFTEEYLTSLGPFGDVVVSLLATLAKQERIRISERTKAGLERARAAGKRLGRPRGTRVHRKIREAKRLRGEGSSYGAIGQVLGVSRQRACQLCQMQP